MITPGLKKNQQTIVMPILFQTVSEQSQKHFQTSIIPNSAKSIVFARKIQLNWGFVPAISHVTKRSFVAPTLLQPCTTHTLQHPRAKGGQLIPLSPAALPSPATPFHLPSPSSSQHTHLPIPHFTSQQQGRKERRKQQRGGKRTQWVISAGHQLFIHTRKETGLKIQGQRPQMLRDGAAQWQSATSHWWLKVSIALVFPALEHTKQKI